MTKSKPLPVAEFLAHHIALSGKSQADIARECGFVKPNVLTMLKQGKMKLPLSRAAALASAIGIEPSELIVRVLEEYEPETWQVIKEHFGIETASRRPRTE